jgi:hypothetical protein
LGEDGFLLMNNQKVEWKNWNGTGNVWGYTPTKYWPINAAELLTLRAYAPYVSYNLQTDANGMPMLPVVVKNDDYHTAPSTTHCGAQADWCCQAANMTRKRNTVTSTIISPIR